MGIWHESGPEQIRCYRQGDCGSGVRYRTVEQNQTFGRGVDCGIRGEGQILNLILSLWRSKGWN